MYSLTFSLQPAAVVWNLNRSFTKNSRFIQSDNHSAIQISNKLTCFYWLRVIRAGNFRCARSDMRGFKNFKGSDSTCPSIHFLFYDFVVWLMVQLRTKKNCYISCRLACSIGISFQSAIIAPRMNLMGYDNATAQSQRAVAHVTSYVGYNNQRLVGVGSSFAYMRAHHD